MSSSPMRLRKGFTLIELMIVVTILAILAALLIPALGRAQAQAQKTRCLATSKGIATTMRTYASGWEGWTNADPNYFIKVQGRKLLNEPGYNANEAKAVKDYRCPADSAPGLNFHGYFSSYNFLLPATNLMAAESRTLMVIEKGSRHPSAGKAGLSFNAVYADGSGGLASDVGGSASSYDPAGAQGALYFIWRTTSPSQTYTSLQTPTLDLGKILGSPTIIGSGIQSGGSFQIDWASWQWLVDRWPSQYSSDKFNPNNNAAYWMVKNVVIRWEGFINFKDGVWNPAFPNTDGNVGKSFYHIWIYAPYPAQWLWIDFNANDKVDAADELWTGDHWTTSAIKDGKYKYVTVYMNDGTSGNWQNPHCRIYVRDAQCYGCGGPEGPYPHTNFYYNPAEAYVPGM